jgi:hypothetical protein
MQSLKTVVYVLGIAGLIPFVIPAVFSVFESEYPVLLAQIADDYAFGIISFLTGSWWGLALTSKSKSAFLVSNILFLVAFVCYLFAYSWWPLAAALILASIYFLEQHTMMFTVMSHQYRNFRALLTLVASSSMLVMFIAG